MNSEELKTILDVDYDGKWEGDNALLGLIIISKYFPGKTILTAADHDLVYSVEADGLIDAGLTEVDAIELSKLNWMIYDDYYMACYV